MREVINWFHFSHFDTFYVASTSSLSVGPQFSIRISVPDQPLTIGSQLTMFCEVVGWYAGASLPSVQWVYPAQDLFDNIVGKTSVAIFRYTEIYQ